MTVDRAALRALLDAATPGPWWAWDRGVGWHIAIGKVPAGDEVPECLPEGSRTDIGRGADARLIAAAVNALPALLDQLDAAEDALRRARELVGQMADADGMDLNRLGMSAQDVLDAAIGRLTTTTGGNP